MHTDIYLVLIYLAKFKEGDVFNRLCLSFCPHWGVPMWVLRLVHTEWRQRQRQNNIPSWVFTQGGGINSNGNGIILIHIYVDIPQFAFDIAIAVTNGYPTHSMMMPLPLLLPLPLMPPSVNTPIGYRTTYSWRQN